MKKIISIIALLILAGCDVGVAPSFDKMNLNTRVYSVFSGTVDGVEYDVRTDMYLCNQTDNFIYRITDNAAVLNTDGTQAACTTYLYTRIETDNTTRSLYEGI